jgi:hypothetical protein
MNLESRKISIKMNKKTKPTRFAGWVGRNLSRSYPHGGEHMQQHNTPALEAQNT